MIGRNRKESVKAQRTLITIMNSNSVVNHRASTAHASSQSIPRTLYRKELAAASMASEAQWLGFET